MVRIISILLLLGLVFSCGWLFRADISAWIAPLPETTLVQSERHIVPDKRTQSYAAPVDSFAAHRFKFLGHTRRWHSYVPENPAQPVHAVILFHGSGRNGASMLDMWQEAADIYGLVLVAPDSREEAGWSSLKDGSWFVRNLVDEVAPALGISPETWFVFGHSAGAVHTLNIVEGGGFAPQRVALHGGGPAPDRVGAASKPTPFRIYVGDEDPLFPLPYMQQSATRLAQVGYPTELITLQNHGHWFYDAGPKIAQDAAAWFLQVAP